MLYSIMKYGTEELSPTLPEEIVNVEDVSIVCRGNHPFEHVKFAGTPLGRPEVRDSEAILKGWIRTKNKMYTDKEAVWICPLCAMHLPGDER